MTTMKQRILDKVEESFLKAEAFYGRKFSRPSRIIFKTTGTIAGHCLYSARELMFQITLAEHEGDKFINRTPAHEVAHYIEKEVYGYSYKGRRRDIHGKNWQFIMTNVMKQEATRCHSYDVSIVKTKRAMFTYKCSNGHTLNLSSVVHNRLLKNPKRYRCKCKGELSLFNDLNTTQQEIEKLKKQIAELQNQ